MDVDVSICVGVNEDVSIRVGETGRKVSVGVTEGTNGGVGERIAGRGDGETIGVVMATEILPTLHPTK